MQQVDRIESATHSASGTNMFIKCEETRENETIDASHSITGQLSRKKAKRGTNVLVREISNHAWACRIQRREE